MLPVRRAPALIARPLLSRTLHASAQSSSLLVKVRRSSYDFAFHDSDERHVEFERTLADVAEVNAIARQAFMEFAGLTEAVERAGFSAEGARSSWTRGSA